jgi:hypothetical protein
VGFKARRVFVLEFADMDGLEVKARSTTIDNFMDISNLTELSPGALFTDEDRDKLDKLREAFAECLVDWNLEEDDGSPIPATLEGLRSLDYDLVVSITRAWMDAVASVSPGKDSRSNGGSPSVEASIPMAALSESQAS